MSFLPKEEINQIGRDCEVSKTADLLCNEQITLQQFIALEPETTFWYNQVSELGQNLRNSNELDVYMPRLTFYKFTKNRQSSLTNLTFL